jgi:hypothetical protein
VLPRLPAVLLDADVLLPWPLLLLWYCEWWLLLWRE